MKSTTLRTNDPSYYRLQAMLARRAAKAESDHAIRSLLEGAARNFEEIAEDLEAGVREVRHVRWLEHAAG